MLTARRPEPSPAMRHANAPSYGRALLLLEADVANDAVASSSSEGLKSLAIPSARSQVSSASATDVAYMLWKHRPVLSNALLRLRIRSLACCIAEEDATAIFEEMQNAMTQYSLTLPAYKEQNCILLRHLRINDGNVTADDLMTIAAMLCGHASMASIALQANWIKPCKSFTMKHFALSVSLSNLRSLELTNNAIGTRSVCQFLDHLHLPCLARLYLSMTMIRAHLADDQRQNELWTLDPNQDWRDVDQDEVWRWEMDKTSERLVRLVQPDVQQTPYAPRLEFLSLNGNDLGWRCVKRLVHAIREGSTALEEVGLFSTLDENVHEDDESDEESVEGVREASRATHRSELRRVISIGSFMRLRSQQSSEANVAISGPTGLTTPPRRRRVDASPKKERSNKQEQITRHSWRRILGSRLWSNQQQTTKAKDASRKFLRTARTLTCKSHEGERQSGTEEHSTVFPFARLPPEVRQEIVKQIDEVRVLSNEQVERIISFASDPSTIGYGHKSADVGLPPQARQKVEREGEAQGHTASVRNGEASEHEFSLLPHKPFRWSETVAKYTVPRDWPATVWDEVTNRMPAPSSGALVLRRDVQQPSTDTSMDNQFGGGGGPDGLGGLSTTDDWFEQQKVSAARRIWLNEEPGLQAFWEATGTFAKANDDG